MKCKIESCIRHEDCGILDILKKEPTSQSSCSYFKSYSSAAKYEKLIEKQDEEINKLKNKKRK